MTDLEDNYINSGQSLGQSLIYPSESELQKLLVQLSTFLSPRLSSRDLHPSDQVFEQEIHNRVSRQLATTCNNLIEYQRTTHYYINWKTSKVRVMIAAACMQKKLWVLEVLQAPVLWTFLICEELHLHTTFSYDLIQRKVASEELKLVHQV
jgi:hypothetical protein